MSLSIDFEQDIENMFYGAQQICIRDPNGYDAIHPSMIRSVVRRNQESAGSWSL